MLHTEIQSAALTSMGHRTGRAVELLADDCRTLYAKVRLVFLGKAHVVQATKLHVIISQLRARPDLVLLDLRLGGFDAADVMPHVREHGSPQLYSSVKPQKPS